MNKGMRIILKVEWRNRKFSIHWISWKQFILQCWHLKISPAHALDASVVARMNEENLSWKEQNDIQE